MPRSIPVLLAVLSALAPTAAVAGQEETPVEVVIEGKGFGHGVGMAQDGAYSMGVAGASADEILAHFYPGTTLGQSSGTVLVSLLERPISSIVVRFPSGGEVRADSGSQPSGFPVSVTAGGAVRVSSGGGGLAVAPLEGATPGPRPELAAAQEAAAQAAQAATTTTTVPSLLGLIPLPPPPTSTTPTTAPPTAPAPNPEEPSDPTSDAPLLLVPSGPTVAVGDDGRAYRGTVRAAGAGGGFQLQNELDVEEYLKGMGEVLDPSWPPAALQAQAIAARTYALDAMRGGRELCSTQLCQVYLGQSVEYSAMSRAVAATSGQVLLFGGSLAEAVYSANGGGISATPEEGFGRSDGDHPYLKPVSYPSPNPDPWELRIGLAQLAARFGYPGAATGVSVTRTGPSGRPLEITFTGDAGPRAVGGYQFFNTLSLRSTLFQIRLEGGPHGITTTPSPGVHRTGGVARVRRPPLVLAADGHPVLGRPPWVALGLLLVVAWSTAAVRYRARVRPPRAT